MKLRTCIVFVFVLFSRSFYSQELFPLNEPASNVPKRVLGVRIFSNAYTEGSAFKNMSALRLMYGLLPKLTVMATASFSNHHGKTLPVGLINHTHSGGQTVYSTGNFERDTQYPLTFVGLHFFAKYRFLTLDGKNSHFRMAAYAEASNVNVAHDETEPNLMDDTKGIGGGFIFTYLKNHFAVSLTSGVIIPGKYKGLSPDTLGGPMIPTVIEYGRAVKYNLSLGYLVIPKTYKNYDDPNLNIYLEFMGKAYESARITQYGTVDVPVSTPLLLRGNYISINPGIQYIIKSNLRIDLSVEFALIGKSFTRSYPVYTLGVQRYFFFKKRTPKNK